MNKDRIKELLKMIETAPNTFGVIGNEQPVAINALAKSVPIAWFEQFAKMVEQETLEKAANHFDERGKNKDGEWSSGYYEVDKPGEILRSLKISD